MGHNHPDVAILCDEVDEAANREMDDDVIPHIPLFAKYGRGALSSILSNWWNHWCKVLPNDDPIAELRHAVLIGEPCLPDGLLAERLTPLA